MFPNETEVAGSDSEPFPRACITMNVTPAMPVPSTRPLFRGYVHLLGAVLSPFAIVWFVLIADSPRAVVGGAIFGASLLLVYAMSAGHHILRWSGLRRLDHAAIYLSIAGTFTPFTLMALSDAWGIPVLSVVWGVAGIGAVQSLILVDGSRRLRTWSYLSLGWLALVPGYELWQSLPLSAFALLLLGGLTYSLGALVYAIRRPNPFPQVFGYHEVFHCLTLVAAGVFSLVLVRYMLSN